MTKCRPILMNASSVNAILARKKTQTRRAISPQPRLGRAWKFWVIDPLEMDLPASLCPYGIRQDRLWVRETWATERRYDHVAPRNIESRYASLNDIDLWWRADHASRRDLNAKPGRWRPSIFMPRWASRITLEIVRAWPERVQDITSDDCEAEGITGVTRSSPVRGLPYEDYMNGDGLEYNTPRDAFRSLWDSINAKRGFPYCDNPWAWAIEFKELEVAK